MRAQLSDLLTLIPGARMTANAAFNGVSTNSKAIARANVFVALRGERFDAHDFLQDVVEQEIGRAHV